MFKKFRKNFDTIFNLQPIEKTSTTKSNANRKVSRKSESMDDLVNLNEFVHVDFHEVNHRIDVLEAKIDQLLNRF